MAKAWYRDDLLDDPKSEHHLNPPQYADIKDLQSLTGLEYFEVDINNLHEDETFQNIRRIGGYDIEDQIEIAREKMSNYDKAIKMFYTEHQHEENEVRLFLDGFGYFDVRDKNDRWIRIKVERRVLLVLPGGTFHRFTPGYDNYAKIMRLYSKNHVWKSIERPLDNKPKTEIKASG